MKIIALTTAAIAALLAAYVATVRQDNQMAESVRNGAAELYCEFRDGRRKVEPDKVESFSDGRWFFSNGSAVNCAVIKND